MVVFIGCNITVIILFFTPFLSKLFNENNLIERSFQMETYDKNWMEHWWRTLVFQYKNTNEWEYLSIPTDYEMDGYKIGNWLVKQEELFSNHKLSSLQLTFLKMLRTKWLNVNLTPDIKWMYNYEQLKLYYQENGTLKMSKDTYMEDGTNLFNWKHQQKQLYKRNQLKPFQIELLEDIDFDWEIKVQDGSSSHSPRWNDYYKAAKQFYEEHGHLLVNESYKVNDIALGKWIQKQKERYIGTRKGELSKDEIRKLESIGMDWRPLLEAKYDFTIKLLTEFMKENKGKQKLTKDTVYKNYELGKEFLPIYRKFKNNDLPKDKMNVIRMLGFK